MKRRPLLLLSMTTALACDVARGPTSVAPTVADLGPLQRGSGASSAETRQAASNAPSETPRQHITSAELGTLSEPDQVLRRAPPPFDPLADRNIDWRATPSMLLLGRIAETLTETRYQHHTQVNPAEGLYAFDCSGMVHWVLRRAAPRAAAASRWGLDHRPLARDFYRRIAKAPTEEPRFGWQRIARVDAIKPGDVIAWIKPSIIKSPNTGHVGFAALPPVETPELPGGYLVRFIDSTSLLHDDDTREGRTGFGLGTILLQTNDAGEPVAYGWAGLRWRSFETQIAIGRPVE